MKNAGVSFDKGLRDAEFIQIENTFGFRFPSEIKSFLACGLPIGDRFYNWRDLSDINVQRFQNFFISMDAAFRFDLENNADDLRASLDERFHGIEDPARYTESVLNYLHQSTKLIPFYAHRCFFDGMDNMPIVSFWQPVDSIFYGENFEDYLETEFLGKKHCINLNQFSAQIKDTGIWYYLIE